MPETKVENVLTLKLYSHLCGDLGDLLNLANEALAASRIPPGIPSQIIPQKATNSLAEI